MVLVLVCLYGGGGIGDFFLLGGSVVGCGSGDCGGNFCIVVWCFLC